MKLALDSHYTIGKLHLCCEDYGCHGRTPLPHVILADGCSAAPDSDVGARLLVLNARRLLPQFMRRDLDTSGRQAQHWRLGRRALSTSSRAPTSLSGAAEQPSARITCGNGVRPWQP
jgi:hypothetical protein